MTHKVELNYKNDPLSQLQASKSNIIDLFNELLGFKYQITVKILFKNVQMH